MTPIWQSPLWPRFRHDPTRTEGSLAIVMAQIGMLHGLHTALPDADQTSLRRIQTDKEAAATLSLDGIAHTPATIAAAQNIAAMAGQGPLSPDHLHQWQALLFPDAPGWRSDTLEIIRTDKSGQDEVLYTALPPDRIRSAVARFIETFNAPDNAPDNTPAPIRAALAYLWWDSVHPYEDGSGVIGRAIMGHILPTAPLSQSMAADPRGHFAALQAGRTEAALGIDGTAFVLWFLDRLNLTLTGTIADANNRVTCNRVLLRLRSLPPKTLPPSTKTAIIGLFAQGPAAVAQGLNVGLYAALAQVSSATASRHLTEMEALGLLNRGPEGGRSTRYHVTL